MSDLSSFPGTPAAVAQPAVSPEQFRACLSRWASGVTVVTASDHHGRPQGFTASSFSSVSQSPPLISVCLDRDANCRDTFEAASCFAVHVLRAGQQDLAAGFARKGADKFRGRRLAGAATGVPLLDDALVRLECRTTQRLPAGDHLILIGEVYHCVVGDGEPLVYFRSRFHRLRPPEAGP
ncbi:flavin reductase family protein [Streptomyces misionensis]|uniref:Flavin reductase family protein n=1 Tax=Streptomyces misionensis TaxID=67331 RepID=A0A5C6K4W7_9ACTN|nr:flavin reductase family protein [Streptomyces misionensis]TWV57416.1 flavin reductase family protein [Streptomyces misionensis]